MWKARAEKAETEVAALKTELQDVRRLLNEYRNGGGDAPPNGGPPVIKETLALVNAATSAILGEGDFNLIYTQIKARAQNDPGILQLLATKPELRVQFEPKVLEADGSTLRGGIAFLIHRGFFSTPKNGHTVFKELQRIGRRVASANVYRELAVLAEIGFLTSESDGYQATDLKVSVKK